ncbi:rhodanese domain-containing protein CG4456 [Procambarus clarkii]|uniref:rhodanese domain-containing protein CG4456 n=1 Tax=Procambarus clarkii TaxID=6728 RepID=UPI001E676D4B|nr:rhodanese domain-containing protein CG4456-like [Procambarus clarkii]
MTDSQHREISYDELAGNLGRVTVIDVRNRVELQQAGQIPGSHCIPVTEIKYACGLDEETFKSRYGFEKPGTQEPLVVCCRTGVRSKTACDILQAKGFKSHRIYRGSFSEWEEKGGDTIKPGQPYEYEFSDSDDDEESNSSTDNMSSTGDSSFKSS